MDRIKAIYHAMFLPAAVICLLVFTACAVHSAEFTVDKDFIYKDGQKFIVKGIKYMYVYPGEPLGWTYIAQKVPPANIEERIERNMRDIKSLNINTIRIYNESPIVYREAKKNGIFILEDLWIEDSGDLHEPAFKERQKGHIREAIDQVHDRNGVDYSDNILAYVVGNELSAPQKTDAKNAEIDYYDGKYISAPKGSTPAECFIAELADYTKQYEQEKYGVNHLVTYANMPSQQLNTEFLDFMCMNLYSASYWCWYSGPAGSRTGRGYQGNLEYLREKHPGKPLIISEFGSSTAPESQYKRVPGHPYTGSCTEDEQAQTIAEMWEDMMTAEYSIAGGSVFCYADQWWMYSRTDSKDDWAKVSTEKQQAHNRHDQEAWWGIISIDGPSAQDYKVRPKKAYHTVKKMFAQ